MMMRPIYEVGRSEFSSARDELIRELLRRTPIYRDSWQSINVVGSSAHATHELSGVMFSYLMPQTREEAQQMIQPDLPWAEDHFQERIGGSPLNPPPSHEYWPHHNGGKGNHQDSDGRFDHTYPERFWPKHVNHRYKVPTSSMPINGYYDAQGYWRDSETGEFIDTSEWEPIPEKGLRFQYGDLLDVVNLLNKDPMTRQAFLPIWFPEDTGAFKEDRHIRVPCSIGYHFIRRGISLDVHYFMRSCDIVRHFANDVYMVVRLAQWVIENTTDFNRHGSQMIFPGRLEMYMSNLHLMSGDVKVVSDAI